MSHPAAVLQTFYRQVSAPLLRRITVQFPDDSVSDVTQNRFDKYFKGSELVVAGKVLPSESNSLTSFISASAVSPNFLCLQPRGHLKNLLPLLHSHFMIIATEMWTIVVQCETK